MDRTLIMIKPDGVKRGLVGAILSRFEQRGFRLMQLKMKTFTDQEAKDFYRPHIDKPFFRELTNFVTSGPVVAAVLEGNSAIEVTRTMIGTTKSPEAGPGTIRGDYALGITDNVIHASDSVESFVAEFNIIFPE